MTVTPCEEWLEHLRRCEQCRRACALRFAGGTPEQIRARCCEAGKPLHEAMCDDFDRIIGEEFKD